MNNVNRCGQIVVSVTVLVAMAGWSFLPVPVVMAQCAVPVPVTDSAPAPVPEGNVPQHRIPDMSGQLDRTLTASARNRATFLPPPPMMNTAAQLNADTERVLRELWDSPTFDSIPLVDIMADISRRLSVQVILDESAKIDQNLTESTLINVAKQRLPLRRFLALVLDKYDCTITIDHGLIKIVSRSASWDRSHMLTKTYDCRDILQWMSEARQSGFDIYTWRHPSITAESEECTDRVPDVSRYLVHLVVDHVGGRQFHTGEAAVAMIDGRLLVTHRFEELAKIEEFIDLLRQQQQ